MKALLQFLAPHAVFLVSVAFARAPGLAGADRRMDLAQWQLEDGPKYWRGNSHPEQREQQEFRADLLVRVDGQFFAQLWSYTTSQSIKPLTSVSDVGRRSWIASARECRCHMRAV